MKLTPLINILKILVYIKIINCLAKDEVHELKKQNQQLTQQNQQLAKKLESAADKLKSLKDFKKEFRAFFSIDGHSELLDTSSRFKKLFCLISMLFLFVYCMIFVDLNYKDFQANDVVTQIRVKENESLIFPALTLCVHEISTAPDLIHNNLTTLKISDVLLHCLKTLPGNVLLLISNTFR